MTAVWPPVAGATVGPESASMDPSPALSLAGAFWVETEPSAVET